MNWPHLLGSAFCELIAGNGVPERYVGTPILGSQNSQRWLFLVMFLGIIFGWCTFAFIVMSPHCCSVAFNPPFHVFPASATLDDYGILGKATGNDIMVATSSVYWLFLLVSEPKICWSNKNVSSHSLFLILVYILEALLFYWLFMGETNSKKKKRKREKELIVEIIEVLIVGIVV